MDHVLPDNLDNRGMDKVQAVREEAQPDEWSDLEKASTPVLRCSGIPDQERRSSETETHVTKEVVLPLASEEYSEEYSADAQPRRDRRAQHCADSHGDAVRCRYERRGKGSDNEQQRQRRRESGRRNVIPRDPQQPRRTQAHDEHRDASETA